MVAKTESALFSEMPTCCRTFPVEYFILVHRDFVEYNIASFVTGNQRAVCSDQRSLPKGSYGTLINYRSHLIK